MLVALTIAIIAAAVTTVSAGKQPSATSSSSNDILRTDGNINWDVFLKILTSCGTAMNMEATVKAVNGYAEECGLKGGNTKEGVAPYKMACGITCVYKSLTLITSENKFSSDEKEIKKIVEKLKFMEDEKRIKLLVKELMMCAKHAPLCPLITRP